MNHMKTVGTITLLLSVLCAAATAIGANEPAPPTFDVKAHYDKREVQIPMRDGVKLHTVIYTPRDQSQRYPILLMRTPYSAGPYGADEFRPPERLAPGDDFLRDGYVFVLQDGRGTHKSEGEWVNLMPVRKDPKGTDETTDNYDTIEWLVRNVPRNNGRVGQWGISHPGWYTVMGMVEPHPALKAVSPHATTYDAFEGDDTHRHGAFALVEVDWWYRMSLMTGPDRFSIGNDKVESIDFGTPWNYEWYLNAGPIDQLNERHFGGRMRQIWHDIIEHPDYDEFWEERNVRKHLRNVRLPVLNVMGWFDAYDPYGAVATYQAIEEQNPRNQSTLVAGPWNHGGWRREDGTKLGDIPFGSRTSEHFQRDIIFPFFQRHLKGRGNYQPPEAIAFDTGGNRWHELDHWPPRGVQGTKLYLREEGRLTFEAPGAPADAYDSYESDPAKPVPYTAAIRRDMGQDYQTEDQRFAYSRPDVLTYQSPVLERDVTIAGSIPVQLFASTTGTDSDWFVKLIDVYPNDAPGKLAGYQMLLGYEVMRGKYRESFAKPVPMVPDEVTPIRFQIRDKFHTFRKGHRIMVQVQSTYFPMIDRNPQVFTNIYRAKPQDFRKATQKVYRTAASASHLVLPVVDVGEAQDAWTTSKVTRPERKPRILLIHDMEGLSGQDDPYSFFHRHPTYAQGQQLLTADVNAVIAGLFDGGAGSVSVVDGHGSGSPDPDLLLDRLDPRAEVVSRPHYFEPYLDLSEEPRQFDAIAMVGMHAKSGSGGFASHAFTIGMQISLEGHSVTEAEVAGLLYGRSGVPIIFVSGDDRLRDDLRTMPWLQYVTTKKATSASTAELFPVAEVHAAMRRQARVAVQRLGDAKVMQARSPLRVSIRAVPPASMSWLKGMPGIDYQDETVSFVAQDIGSAYRGMSPVVTALNFSFDDATRSAFDALPEAEKLGAQGIEELFRRWFDAESGRVAKKDPARDVRTKYFGSE
jgi:putative CocE/NonD family hydrolase